MNAGVDPAGFLPQLLIGAAQGGGVLLLQQGVFLAETAHILQKLLGVHLQDFHGLEQLGGELELLAQFGFQRDEAHRRSPPFSGLEPTYLAIFRAAVAWEMPSSLATATVVPQRW